MTERDVPSKRKSEEVKPIEVNVGQVFKPFANLTEEILGEGVGFTATILFRGIRGSISLSKPYIDLTDMDFDDYLPPDDEYDLNVLFEVPSDREVETIKKHTLGLRIREKDVLFRPGAFVRYFEDFDHPERRRIAFVAPGEDRVDRDLETIRNIEAEIQKRQRSPVST